MDLFLRQGPTDADAKALNRVRRHLQVYSLADIATGDGRSIQTMFTCRSCLRHDAVMRSNLCWPVENPTARDFGIWLTYLNAITRSDFRLHHKLGNWLIQSHITPTWLYDKSLKQLLRPTGPDKWTIYTVTLTARTRFQRHQFVPSSTVSSLSTFGKILPAIAEKNLQATHC